MKQIEYTTMDKSTWGEGPWQDEPDKRQWEDKETGYPCLIVRNHMGGWCGYVGVAPGHPWYKKDYNDLEDERRDCIVSTYIDVHGGLTFAALCMEGPEESSICHIPEPGEPEPLWWLGFDCGHSGDFMPAMYARELLLRKPELAELVERRKQRESYRDVHYVTAEVERLARQVKEAE